MRVSLCVLVCSYMQSTAERRTPTYLIEWYRPGSCSSSFGRGLWLGESLHIEVTVVVFSFECILCISYCICSVSI